MCSVQGLQGGEGEVRQLHQVGKYQDQQCNHTLVSSGPIMPRINECLAGRQQLPPPGVDEGVGCPAGCAAVCVGPQCEGEGVTSTKTYLKTLKI